MSQYYSRYNLLWLAAKNKLKPLNDMANKETSPVLAPVH